jgi:hypothetical protein
MELQGKELAAKERLMLSAHAGRRKKQFVFLLQIRTADTLATFRERAQQPAIYERIRRERRDADRLKMYRRSRPIG